MLGEVVNLVEGIAVVCGIVRLGGIEEVGRVVMFLGRVGVVGGVVKVGHLNHLTNIFIYKYSILREIGL